MLIEPSSPDTEALRDSEAQKAAILETALDCIVVMDADGLICDWNPAAERTFGYRREEVLGCELAEKIIPPGLREMHRRGLAHYLATGEGRVLGRRIEVRGLRADDTEFPCELAITPIRLGERPLFTAYLRDISERRRSEQRRAAQLAVTRLLTESVPLSEAARRVLHVICENLQWDLGALWVIESEKLRCADLWSDGSEKLAPFERATRDVLLQRGEGLPGRIWDEGQLWLVDVLQEQNFPRLSLAAECGLRGAFGFAIQIAEKVVGVLEFFSHDVRQVDHELLEMFPAIGTQIGQFIERRKAEEAVRALNADLERRIREATMELAEANLRLLEALEREQELGRLKSNFVSLVSHEFRTPLAIILSSSEILDRYLPTLDEAERTEQLGAIKANILRMSSLMEEVLLFGQVDAGQLSCNPTNLDLGEFARGLCEEMGAATNHRCPIVWNAETDLSGAYADEALLHHLFSNLLENAVKYSPDQSPVELTARRENKNAVFHVRDRGVGIPCEAQKHLFHAFHRAENVANVPGTGLGLVVVKRCVELHGGTIDIQSAEGSGTSARVVLPLYSLRAP